MAFQVSPGVNVSEVDLTASIPAISVSTGAFAGNFNWGPIELPITISSETELVNVFSKPDAEVATSFFTAASFLAYSNDLLVVRASGANVKNAVAASNTELTPASVLIENEETYFSNEYTGTGNSEIAFAARYAGDLGNSLKISVCPSESAFSTWEYRNAFEYAPGTSVYAERVGGADDELHIAIIDEVGAITGTANTILERFSNVSKASDAKNEDGSSNYYKEVLFTNSRYVYWINHISNDADGTDSTNWGSVAADTTFGASDVYDSLFVGGSNVDPANVSLVSAYQIFENSEKYDISLLLGGAGELTVAQSLLSVAESRKDCLAFISPPQASVLTSNPTAEISSYASSVGSSSYVVLDSGLKYMYDKYNDVYRWIPLNGDIAGLCARTDNERDPWFSPAGFQRGQIRNVVKLAFNPNKEQRDTLYKAGVNPVVSFPGEGTVLFGDKTLLRRPSSFDRINVRRLFIVLEKAISRAARASLFEFNDEFTRAQFVSIVEPFLRTVQGRRGIFDYRVVCDETNNTPDVIDRNEFVGDIYVKPARSVNYIQLNFVSVRTGVAFEEIVGRF